MTTTTLTMMKTNFETKKRRMVAPSSTWPRARKSSCNNSPAWDEVAVEVQNHTDHPLFQGQNIEWLPLTGGSRILAGTEEILVQRIAIIGLQTHLEDYPGRSTPPPPFDRSNNRTLFHHHHPIMGGVEAPPTTNEIAALLSRHPVPISRFRTQTNNDVSSSSCKTTTTTVATNGHDIEWNVNSMEITDPFQCMKMTMTITTTTLLRIQKCVEYGKTNSSIGISAVFSPFSRHAAVAMP